MPITLTGGGVGASSYLGLSDTPSGYGSQALKYARVNAAENAIEFESFPALVTAWLALTDTPSVYTSQALKYCRVNAAENAIEFESFPALVTAWLALTDTPSSFAGKALDSLRVNAGETALEFYTPSGGVSAFTGLSDSPANYTGYASQLLKVNSAETALEFGIDKSKPTEKVTTAAEIETIMASPDEYEHIFVDVADTLLISATMDLPTGGRHLIQWSGRGMNRTLIKAPSTDPLFQSQERNWDNSPLIFESKDIGFIAYDDKIIENDLDPSDAGGNFWVPRVQNTRWDFDCANSTKGIMWGGSGADPPAGYSIGCAHNHLDGISTNMAMRIWLENFTSIGDLWVMKSNPTQTVGYLYEMMGTKALFANLITHHWQGRNITGALWYINGDEMLLDIDTVYMNQSGGSAATFNKLVRINNSYADSRATIRGTIKMLSAEESLDNLYYDDFTCIRTKPIGVQLGWSEYAMPESRFVELYRHSTSTSTWAVTTTLADIVAQNAHAVDLRKWSKVVIQGIVNADASGNHELSIYNEDDSEVVATLEYTGNAQILAQSDPISLISLTNRDGLKSLSLWGKSSVSTNLRARHVYATFYR